MTIDAGKSTADTEAGPGATSGATSSLWLATHGTMRTRPLGADVETDVCVIGAGIAGLTTAYLLAREGKRVVVLDDGPIGGGETGRTTAHFVNAVDDRYERLERTHGATGARLVAESHTRAIDEVCRIVQREGRDCQLERLDGYLFVPPGDDVELLDRELEAARRAGVPGVEKLPRAPLRGFETGPALRFPAQVQLHPLRYLDALRASIEGAGGRIFTGTHAAEVDESSPARVVTGDGPVVTAAAVVIATNTPVVNRVAIHTKQAAYRTYVVAFPVPRGDVVGALYWDTGDPYHYVRLHAEPGASHATLISGGEDHKTGQADDSEARFARIERWTRERFGTVGAASFRWSGQIMEPVDGLGFLGRNPGSPDHIYVITGDSGNGMTHCTIGAMIVADLIGGRENPWASLYDPSRVSLHSVGTFFRENLNVAGRYVELATAGEVDDESKIRPGEGAVVRHGLKKLAVSRDAQGTLRRFSAACPHLGCVVHWNGGEKTFDCPCHGSRFDVQGKVVNGPSNRDLADA